MTNPAQDVSDARITEIVDALRRGYSVSLADADYIARELQQARVMGEGDPGFDLEIGPDGKETGYFLFRDKRTTPQSSAPVVGEEPDLFWDDNDPEFARESIDEVVHRRWEDGNLVTGDTVTVQRAIRLSNVTVIATVPDEYPDGDTEITYTVVESALTGRR